MEAFLDPEGGDSVEDFVLEDSDEFFVFLFSYGLASLCQDDLTVGQALYKYMRIYLWTFVWQLLVLCEMLC